MAKYLVVINVWSVLDDEQAIPYTREFVIDATAATIEQEIRRCRSASEMEANANLAGLTGHSTTMLTGVHQVVRLDEGVP